MSGADQRQDDLFSLENIFAKGRTALKGLKVGRIFGWKYDAYDNLGC